MFRLIKDYITDNEFRVNLFNDSVNIINYCKIITIEKSRISLSYTDGILIIKGDDLALKKMLDNEVLICGLIKSIELERI